MSSWQDLEKADDLIVGLRAMDEGREASDGFDVRNCVAAIGVRSLHYFWGVNQIVLANPELRQHLQKYSNGFLVQVLLETVRVLVEEVGGYREHDLLIQYGLYTLE